LLPFPRWFIITGFGTFCCTSLAEPVREVKQNVPYPVMMNQRGKCNKTYHTQ
jgi:hypothetical protein